MSGLSSACGAIVVFNPYEAVFEKFVAMVARCLHFRSGQWFDAGASTGVEVVS